jgi:hypothetical protein
MPKLYFEIIDDCIDKFRLEDGRTFNFSLLDFRDEVFNNFGYRSPSASHDLTPLLSHAQRYVKNSGAHRSSIQKLKNYMAIDLSILPPAEKTVREIFDIIFNDRPVPPRAPYSSHDVARLVSFMPLKHYWDNSGALYQRTSRDEASFANVYLCQFSYDEHHRRPAEALCREMAIAQSVTDPQELEEILAAFHAKPFVPNREYFGLLPEDEELYDIYGQLFDMLNWGVSNPEPIINYLSARACEFYFYNCVFPVVFHGIYYGIAYFDLPADYFQPTREAAERLSRMLVKGWTYVNHYFPAIIMDAYNSRLISRFSRGNVEDAEGIVSLVNSKVPFRFCHDRGGNAVYYFRFEAGAIEKTLHRFEVDAEWNARPAELLEKLGAVDATVKPGHLQTITQEILGHDLVFVFDLERLPGREKCLPILESHLAQAAFVLQTMKDQGERHVFEERNRMLDMLAHDNKTTRELLISDLEEGLDSDLAALQLHEQSLKERMMHDYLLRRPSLYGDDPAGQESRAITLSELFADLFRKSWRVWLKSRRFRASLRRNRHPSFPLGADSSREEITEFMQAFFLAYPQQPERACLEMLGKSFLQVSPGARIAVNAPPLVMMEQAVFRIETILYNLLCNFFKHAAPSPLTGYNECVMEVCATPKAGQVDFNFSFSNSTSTRERFAGEVQAMLGARHEIHGLQIVLFLIEKDAGTHPPMLKVKQEDYLWHIEVGRECYGCFENTLVDAHSRRSP